MKTLVDIQVELRSLNNKITALSSDIEELKPTQANDIESLYKNIEKIAKKYPIENKELVKATDSTKKTYFQFLVLIANEKNVNLAEQVLFIQKILNGISYDKEIVEIFKECKDLDDDFMDNLLKNIGSLKYSLLLDALIVANITGCASDDELTVIADAAKILKCDKEDLIIVSKLASAIIQEDATVLSSISWGTKNKLIDKFKYMISRELIIKSRMICCEYQQNTTTSSELFYSSLASKYGCEVKKIANSGKWVKEGDKVVEYEYMRKLETITAPKDGIVFLDEKNIEMKSNLSIKYVKVYIVSCFDEYDDFCAWLKKKKN